MFTHGIEAGEAAAGGRDVRDATDALVASLAQANPGLQRASEYQVARVGDRRGLRVNLSYTSDVTNERERIALYTALLADNHLFYAVAVAPVQDFAQYQESFSKVIASLKLTGHE